MLPSQPAVHPDAHDRESYDQLCALASSGALTASEWNRLADHLRGCGKCREELGRYQELATFGTSLVAPNDVSLDVENEWSPESAVAKFMRTLQEQEVDAEAPSKPDFVVVPNSRPWLSAFSFRQLNAALPYAAALVLFAAISVVLYAVGVWTGEQRVNAHPQSGARSGSTLEALLRERGELVRQLQSRSAEIEKISQQLQDERAVVEGLQALKDAADKTIQQLEQKSKDQETENATISSQYRTLEQDRIAISEKVKESEARLVAVQRSFDLLRDQHAADLVQIAELENRLAAVAHQPRPAEYVEARSVSSSDPDLRELMGARELFIADVYDIDQRGLRRRPFGRVFYTKGKSLLFYAFDLDQQAGVKAASTFQVWGRRGYGDTHPVNMGMMYLDSEMSKRWVLKFNDAKALSQVDAVFVTIEPRGGSDVPKGRQLLYASLRTRANHP
jgi:hypothetical protein